MGRKGWELIKILMVLYHFYSTMAAPSALREEALPVDFHYQETDPKERYSKNAIANQFGTRSSASLMAHAGSGHGSAYSGGDNGGNRSPHSGGSAVIPVYAAGSANHRQNQHHNSNAGHCNKNTRWLLVAAVLASIAHLGRAF